MPTFGGCRASVLWVPTSPGLRVQLFSSSFSQNSLPLSCFIFKPPFSSCCKEDPAAVSLASPHLCLLNVCTSLHTHCLSVCLPPLQTLFLISTFHPHPVLFQKLVFFFFHSLPVSLLLLCPYLTIPALVSVLGLWPLKSMIQVLWQVSGKPCASSFPPHRFYSVHDSLVGGQPIASPALLAPSPYYGEFRKYSCPSSQDDLELGPLC